MSDENNTVSRIASTKKAKKKPSLGASGEGCRWFTIIQSILEKDKDFSIDTYFLRVVKDEKGIFYTVDSNLQFKNISTPYNADKIIFAHFYFDKSEIFWTYFVYCAMPVFFLHIV